MVAVCGDAGCPDAIADVQPVLGVRAADKCTQVRPCTACTYAARQCLAYRTHVLRNVEMLPTQPMFYIQTMLFATVVAAAVLYAEGVSDSVINVPSVVTLSFEYLVLRAVTALKCVALPAAALACPPFLLTQASAWCRPLQVWLPVAACLRPVDRAPAKRFTGTGACA